MRGARRGRPSFSRVCLGRAPQGASVLTFQERARKLTAHYPNNAELQTLLTSLESKKKKLDERKHNLDQSGRGLQTQEFEFLDLDLCRVLRVVKMIVPRLRTSNLAFRNLNLDVFFMCYI